MRQSRHVNKEDSLNHSVNYLCIIGAVVGAAAVFGPWLSFSAGDLDGTTTLSRIVSTRWSDDTGDLFFIGGGLFIGGTVLAAVLSPISGFAQIAGLALFYMRLQDIEYAPSYSSYGVGTGFYMGVLSAAIVVVSLLRPTGTGYQMPIRSWAPRLLVFARAGTGGVGSSGPRNRITRALSRVKRDMRWEAVLVAVAITSAAFSASVAGLFQEDQVLTEVTGGVAWELSVEDGSAFGLWSSIDVVLGDGEDSVAWDLSEERLDAGTWVADVLPTMDLGGLNVTLTVIDWSGDGRAMIGDSIMLTASGGGSFEDGRTYTVFVVKGVVTDDGGYICWSGMIVAFLFHDGCVDSWITEDVRIGL